MHKNNTTAYIDLLDEYLDAVAKYQKSLPHGIAFSNKIFEKEVENASPDFRLQKYPVDELILLTHRLLARALQIDEIKPLLHKIGLELRESSNYKTPYDRSIVQNGFLRIQDSNPRKTLSDRCQEILSARYERIPGLSSDDMEKIVIDPENINTKLLDLIGKPYPKKKMNRVEKMKYKSNPLIISEIKRFFASLEDYGQLEASGKKASFRIYRITIGPKTGKLLIFRSIDGTNPTFTHVDIYGAVRQMKYINDFYGNESEQLQIILNLIHELDCFFLEKNKDLFNEMKLFAKKFDIQDGYQFENFETNKEGFPLMETYFSMIKEIIALVENSLNHHKSSIKSKLIKTLKIYQKSDKPKRNFSTKQSESENYEQETVKNQPLAPALYQKRSIWNSVASDTGKRINEIQRIQSIIQGVDNNKLSSIAHLHEKSFEHYENFIVQAFSKKTGNISSPVFSETPSNMTRRERLICSEAIYEKIVRPLDLYIGIDKMLEPFQSFAKIMYKIAKQLINEYTNTIDLDDNKILRMQLDLYLISKLQRLYVRVNTFYERFFCDENCPSSIDTAFSHLQTMLYSFKKRAVFPSIQASHFNEGFSKAEKWLSEAVEIIKNYSENNDLSSDKFVITDKGKKKNLDEKLKRKIREHLKKLDFTLLINEIMFDFSYS